MNNTFIGIWNQRVEKHEEVYVLGDFAFWYTGAQSIEDMFSELHGQKHLVVGNHDQQNRRVLKLPWITQSELKYVS